MGQKLLIHPYDNLSARRLYAQNVERATVSCRQPNPLPLTHGERRDSLVLPQGLTLRVHDFTGLKHLWLALSKKLHVPARLAHKTNLLRIGLIGYREAEVACDLARNRLVRNLAHW